MDRPFPPTERRVLRALDEGNVPISGFALRAAALSAALLMAPGLSSALSFRFRALFSEGLGRATAVPMEALTREVWALAWPIVAVTAGVAVALGVLQTGGRVHFGRGPGSEDRLATSSLSAARGALSILLLSAALWLSLRASGGDLARVLDPAKSVVAISTIATRVSWGLAGTLGAMAAVDVLLTRALWRRSLRMSRREVVMERKLAEAPLAVRQARQRAFEKLVRGPQTPHP